MMLHLGDEIGGDDACEGKMADITSESWTQVNTVQKRNLDQWCFAEHMEAGVLKQVK